MTATIAIHVIECPGPPNVIPEAVGQHWVDTLNRRLYESVGTVSVDDWICLNQQDIIITADIPASSSLDLDVTPMSDFCTAKYIVCLFNTAEDKFRSFEMLAGKSSATTVEDTLYSLIGATMDVDFDFSVSGTDAKLIGTNNESFDVSVRIHRNAI